LQRFGEAETRCKTTTFQVTNMAKSKNDIKLVSSANTGFFYVTKKVSPD
jgi:hypothetical protein